VPHGISGRVAAVQLPVGLKALIEQIDSHDSEVLVRHSACLPRLLKVFATTILHVSCTTLINPAEYPVSHIFSLWSRLGSNQRPSACEAAKIVIDLRFKFFCASYTAH
jgi:hypothetical protein